MKANKKKETNWRTFYWIMVCAILIALVFMVRFVLNSSKIFVTEEMSIHPLEIKWGLERDGSLRVNDPFYLNTESSLIQTNVDLDKNDSVQKANLLEDLKGINYLKDVNQPYLLWKNKNSDTIHLLKNNVYMNFYLKQDSSIPD